MPPNALMERLAAADLAINATPDQDAAEALLREVLSVGAAATDDDMEAPAISRSRWRVGRRLIPTALPRGRLKRWAAVGTAAVAAAVALLVVGTTGGGPTRAFAGWSATPTTPATGQLAAAEATCQQRFPAYASTPPTLADTRGPFSLLLYGGTTANIVCVTGWSFGGAIGGGTVYPGAIRPGSVTPTVIDPTYGTAGGMTAEGHTFSYVTGQAGADVTSVTLTLDDGSQVEATVASGWYAAWWPGSQGAQQATIATTSGTTTQSLTTGATAATGATATN